MNKHFKVEVERTVAHLKAGHIILYPTDTLWGLGCDATQPQAVERILAIKGRDAQKGMLVLLDDSERLSTYVANLPMAAKDFVDAYPTALTLIYPKGQGVAPQLQPLDGSIAIRIVKHDFCQTLIAALGQPLVSTSANFSGQQAPQSFADIQPELLCMVDYIVDWERDKPVHIKASTLARWQEGGNIQIIRQ